MRTSVWGQPALKASTYLKAGTDRSTGYRTLPTFVTMRLSPDPADLTPRPSRKSNLHPGMKSGQFISWPGYGRFVSNRTEHYKAIIDSRAEARGELPPTARLLVSAGSRPPFPSFATTACH